MSIFNKVLPIFGQVAIPPQTVLDSYADLAATK